MENLGSGINSADAEYEFLPAPDGTWGLLSTDKGFFHVKKTGEKWARDFRFGSDVNANGSEIGPYLVDSHGSFVFSRDAGGEASGELFLASSSGKTAAFRCY